MENFDIFHNKPIMVLYLHFKICDEYNQRSLNMRQLSYIASIFIINSSFIATAENLNYDPHSNIENNGFETVINEIKRFTDIYSVEQMEAYLTKNGYDLNTSLPQELVKSAFEKGTFEIANGEDSLTLGELFIQQNSSIYLEENAKLEYIKSLKNRTPEQLKEFTELTGKLMAAKWNLEDLKKRDPLNFNKALEKLKLPADIKCTVGKQGEGRCHWSDEKLLTEAFKKGGKIKLSNFKGLIGRGESFHDYFEELKLAREEEARLAANNQNGQSETQDSEESQKYKCTIDALKFYRKDLIKVPKSFPYHTHIIGGSGSKVGQKTSCQLVEMSFHFQEKPFKRILDGGSIIDSKGNSIALDQAKFDQILRSWNIIPWNENSKMRTKPPQLTPRLNFKRLQKFQTQKDDGDGVQ